VVTKDEGGYVHVNKDEMATRHGAWGGAAVGAVVGILFPPSIIGTAIVGAAVGGVGGHLWRGMSRADVKEFGDVIDEGQAALVIVGESKVEQAIDKAELKAEKHVAKELDVSAKDVDKEVEPEVLDSPEEAVQGRLVGSGAPQHRRISHSAHLHVAEGCPHRGARDTANSDHVGAVDHFPRLITFIGNRGTG
jgi:uncharacterized membrane protein